KRRELIDHRVDGFLELQNLALHIDGDLAVEVAARDGRGHVGDVADLPGEVESGRAPGRGEILPRAGHACDRGLAAELTLGADLARHATDLAGEGVELVHHRVERVFQCEDFALDLDGDLRGEIALGDGRRHVGDVADLPGEV